MSKKQNSLALLPNGVVDLLSPEAQGEADSISVLMEKFSSFGYHRIKPPLVEFEDSLLAPGPGARLASETFRLMDPVTHRMLGVRSDITPQIARIVSSRLENVVRPLRLMYANDVLRTRGSQIRMERQFTQVGCELIGCGTGVDGDIEICILAVLGLKAVGICDVTLDLTVPGIVNELLGGIDNHVVDDVLKAVSQRDVDAVDSFGLEQTSVLADVMRASGAAKPAFDVLVNINSPKLITDSIRRLKTVCDGVDAALDDLGITDVDLTIDMVEQDGFEYHRALGFTLFTRSMSGELGRGGCYDVCFGYEQSGETAKGFTLYMDTILKCVVPGETRKSVLVSMDAGWAVIADLQGQGWVTVIGGDEHVASSGCTHIYKNGTITEIS